MDEKDQVACPAAPSTASSLTGGRPLLDRLDFYALNLCHAGNAAGDPLLARKVKVTCDSASTWMVDDLRPTLAELYEALKECATEAENCFRHHYGDNPEGGYPEYLQRAFVALAKAEGK